MQKALQLLASFASIAIASFKEAGGFGKVFFGTLLMKLLKSELWVVLVAMAGTLMTTQLGISEDLAKVIIGALNGLAMVYVGGRSFAKGKEAAAVVAINTDAEKDPTRAAA